MADTGHSSASRRVWRYCSVIAALTEQYRQTLRLALECPVSAIEVGANYDEQMTPPPIFERFFTPIYREARQILSSRNKIMVIHGDGDMKVLLEKLMECGVQVVEAFLATGIFRPVFRLILRNMVWTSCVSGTSSF